MLLKATLLQIISAQRENLQLKTTGLKREALSTLPDLTSHALIVSGIRRCGKSTLLLQLLKTKFRDALYINFEDPRLYEFDQHDFTRLDDAIKEIGSRVLLFDEVQIVPGWERYVRHKLDQGYKLVVTGSNASLLSRELGTKLTGRHITRELFPFSYREFISFKELNFSEDSLLQYLETGGFPEYVKSGTEDILNHLFEDILIRDIAVRYGVRDVKALQRLALYLISNVASLITGNRLKTLFDFGATSTVMEYLSHLEYSYLLHFVPKFSYSQRKQIANPRKIYAIDTGMVTVNSGSFTEDRGRKLENLIFLHVRRLTKEIYYFSEKGECDFIIFYNGEVQKAIQVCYSLDEGNLDRELNGLVEALEFFHLDTGTIVTLNQTDHFEKNGKTIYVVSCQQFLRRTIFPSPKR